MYFVWLVCGFWLKFLLKFNLVWFDFVFFVCLRRKGVVCFGGDWRGGLSMGWDRLWRGGIWLEGSLMVDVWRRFEGCVEKNVDESGELCFVFLFLVVVKVLLILKMWRSGCFCCECVIFVLLWYRLLFWSSVWCCVDLFWSVVWVSFFWCWWMLCCKIV